MLPAKIAMAFKQQFNYTGFQADEEIFAGSLALFSIVLGLIIAVIVLLVFDFDLLFLPVFFAVFAAFVFAVPYFWLDSAAEANGKAHDEAHAKGQSDLSIGSPKGNRTPVSAVRGRYPRPLDDGTGQWLGD